MFFAKSVNLKKSMKNKILSFCLLFALVGCELQEVKNNQLKEMTLFLPSGTEMFSGDKKVRVFSNYNCLNHCDVVIYPKDTFVYVSVLSENKMYKNILMEIERKNGNVFFNLGKQNGI